jgi:hypothetical protein
MLGVAAVVTASAFADAAANDEPVATYVQLDSGSTPVGIGRIIAAQQADAQAAASARDAAAAAQAAAAEAARQQAAEAAARASRAQARVALASRDPRTIARLLVNERGWGSAEFSCLDDLWSRESGWNVHDVNGSSGAYGIPQALPASKMALYGSDWRDNPVTQIRWGLYYIASRYGTPCNAWAHSQDRNWY